MSNNLFGFIPRKTMDVPDTATERIVRDPFLSQLFTDELNSIRNFHQKQNGLIVEIGAAGGNTKVVWPEVITTDVRSSVGVDKIMSAEVIDFPDNSIALLFGMDALHHVRNPEAHFFELQRALKHGGEAIYIEPNWNKFSVLCFKYLLRFLHPEPYNVKIEEWTLSDPDPMMGNQAQAFNIFVRDKKIFESKYPNLKIEYGDSLKGISFLLSGGVHTRLPIPASFLLWMYRKENGNEHWIKTYGLGKIIKITKD